MVTGCSDLPVEDAAGLIADDRRAGYTHVLK
jgi:hypothetical protein